MRVLRHSKETLLTLLEAFVYDPLVRTLIRSRALTLPQPLPLLCVAGASPSAP